MRRVQRSARPPAAGMTGPNPNALQAGGVAIMDGRMQAAPRTCLMARRPPGLYWIDRIIPGSEARMLAAQSLSEEDRRLVAAWAADCAERVLGAFEQERPDDTRPRAAIGRTRAFARGELNTALEIRRRFADGGAARDCKAPAAAAAARAAGQAAAVCHMGAHALGAAAYAVRAASLTAPDPQAAAKDEIRWQLEAMTADVRAVLKTLPFGGQDRSGPLGPACSPPESLAASYGRFSPPLPATR